MEPRDVAIATYLACLVELVGEYTGTKPASRALSTGHPREDTSDLFYSTLVRFGEERVWGSSVLVANEASLSALAVGDVDDPVDWLGELNNQLVGRLKNRLLRSSVNLQVSPPVPVVGFVKDRGPTTGWVVEWPSGRMTVYLGLSVTPGVTLADDDATEVAAEGSLILF